MQVNAYLIKVINNPVLRMAAANVALEIMEAGLQQTVDKYTDKLAYSIAKIIVQNEKNTKEKL